MRISDWSSDVCSSDLADDVTRICFFDGLAISRHEHQRVRHPHHAVEPHAVNVHALAVDAGADPQERDAVAMLGVHEIGREACRERVCQYVSITVVAVSLKQKIIHNKTETR